MSLVDSNWLEKNLNKIKIIDCSWHMPQTERSGFEEYNIGHWVVSEAVFLGLARVVKDLRGVFDENC